MKTLYTVWVGGVEVNDYLLTLEQAESIAKNWIDDGYDDVQIDVYKEGQTNEQRNDSQTKARVQKKVLDRGFWLVQYRIIDLLNMAWVLLYVIKSLVHFV